MGLSQNKYIYGVTFVFDKPYNCIKHSNLIVKALQEALGRPKNFPPIPLLQLSLESCW